MNPTHSQPPDTDGTELRRACFEHQWAGYSGGRACVVCGDRQPDSARERSATQSLVYAAGQVFLLLLLVVVVASVAGAFGCSSRPTAPQTQPAESDAEREVPYEDRQTVRDTPRFETPTTRDRDGGAEDERYAGEDADERPAGEQAHDELGEPWVRSDEWSERLAAAVNALAREGRDVPAPLIRAVIVASKGAAPNTIADLLRDALIALGPVPEVLREPIHAVLREVIERARLGRGS